MEVAYFRTAVLVRHVHGRISVQGLVWPGRDYSTRTTFQLIVTGKRSYVTQTVWIFANFASYVLRWVQCTEEAAENCENKADIGKIKGDIHCQLSR